ncbi:hypothetical protein GVAV_000923 [Gurleya vavrai]
MDTNNFDYVILGTGLPQCIASAYLSKSKYKVIQIDSNQSYGSELRTLKYLEICKIFNKEPKNELSKLDKKFNIDLNPKFILADGLFKDLLLKNNLEDLISFITIQGSFVYKENKLKIVPVDEKSSVSSGLIGLMQKPRVARFFWNVRKYCELKEKLLKEHENKNLGESNNKNLVEHNNIDEKKIIDKKIDEKNLDEKNNNNLDKNKNNINQDEKNSSNLDKKNISNLDKKNISNLDKNKIYFLDENDAESLIDSSIENKVNALLKKEFLCKNTMREEFKNYSINEKSIEIIGHAIALNLNNSYLEKHPIETYDKIYYYIKSILSLNETSSPFIYPLYGLSEICQAFSRRAAQFGCIFMLNTEIMQINTKENILEENKEFQNNDLHDKKPNNDFKFNENKNLEEDVLNKKNLCKNDLDKKINEIKNSELDKSFENLEIKDKKFRITICENNKTRKIFTSKIIAEPFYFKNNTLTKHEIITCICIVKGNIKLFDQKNKISSGHVIFLATEFQRKNDIFMAVLGERENVAPEGFQIAIISTKKETKDHEKEIKPVVDLLGNVVEKFIYLREIKEKTIDDEDIRICENLDQTTHFESLYEEILRVCRI